MSSRTLRNEANLVQESSRKRVVSLENPNVTLGQMLLILYDVLQEYMSFSNINERASPGHQIPTIGSPSTDVNNNDLIMITTHNAKRSDLNTDTTKDHESDCRCTGCAPRSTAVCAKDCTNLTCKKRFETVSTRDIGSSIKDTLGATSFPTSYEKCRKSSYRDISKDFYPEKSVKKLKRSPRCNLTCHLRRVKDPLSLQEKQKVPCRIECLNDNVRLPVPPTESFPLLITDRQGLIEIHISRLQFSTSIARIPDEEDICNLHVYISWDIWGEKTAYTPRMKCPNLIFNSSSVYRVADLFTFFKNVLSEYLVFRVNIVRRDGTSCTLARARVSIKDILDYPQNKLHYIVPVNSVISCFFGVNFGQLSLWVRLSCNVDMVEAFKKQCGITSLRDALHAPPVEKDTPRKVSGKSLLRYPSRRLSTVDVAAFEDSKDRDGCVSEKPKDQFRPPDSNFRYEGEGSSDENDYVNSNNEKLSSPIETKTLEEQNKMISIKSLDSDAGNGNEKKENRTPRDSSSMMEFKTLLANHLEKDTIIIEIVSIQLLGESCVMQDDEIRLLYIEYSFLGHYGKDMETVSMKKPKTANQEIIYNFKRKFRTDEQTHLIERNNLRAMLDESISPNIEFIVISEPLPEESEVKDCEEIGYTTFNIKKYALGDGYEHILLPIKDNQNKQIGALKITVWGFDAIRQCLPDVKIDRS